MQEIEGDIFDFLTDKDTDAICIFTNGIVNEKGLAIAGAGQAGAASKRWNNFRYILGTHIQEHGNVTNILGKVDHIDNLIRINSGILLISFPTKHHFFNPSVPELIKQSAEKLKGIADVMGLKKVIMGRPGCGKFTGQLDWVKDIKPMIENILDDRFIIVNKTAY